MKSRHLQTSFNAGQLSRRLHPRTDLGVHSVGVAEMLNMVPTVEGAAVKRPGTYYRAAAGVAAMRLTDFVFNATQAYLLEWSPGSIRFVTNNAFVLDGQDPLQVSVPYLAADIPRISYEQSGDVLYLAQASHQQAVLQRTSATEFSYSTLDLVGGPFADPNGDDSATVTVTGTLTEDGSVTITANQAIFQSGHVGSRFRVEAKDFGDIRAWQEGIDGVTVGVRRRSEGRVYQAETSGRTGYNQPIHDTGSEWDGDGIGQDVNENGPFGVRWRYLHDRFGIIRLTNFVSATQMQGVVERAVPQSLATTASSLWAHGLFSSVEGWPEHVFLWRGRLWWISGFILAGSVAGDYRDHNEFAPDGSRDGDQAIRLRMDLTDRVLWVKADRDQVLLGTARGEWAIRLINPAEGVQANNLTIDRQRKHGSDPVWPVEAGGEVFMVQRGGRKIRAMQYAFSDDRYTARWTNLYARHATATGVIELSFQAEPEELVLALRSDGKVSAHPVNVEQEVKGWATGIDMGEARILSQQEIPSPDGSRDDLWLLVEREGQRSLEQLADWVDDERPIDIAEAYHLDSGVSFSVEQELEFAGLTHLAGETVSVLADGKELQAVVDQAGVLTLEERASRVHVGYPFTARLKLLNPELPQPNFQGTSFGVKRKTQRIALYVIDSVAVMVGRFGSLLARIFPFRQADPMPSVQPLETGWSDPKVTGGDRLYNADDVIEDTSAYPLILPAVMREIETE